MARRLLPAGLPLLVAGCAPAGVTDQGQAINGLYKLFMYAAAVVFAVVTFLILWSIVFHRRKNDELPQQTHGNSKLEATWTIIPLILVAILFAATLRTQDRVLDQSGGADLTVDVTAYQWSWRFEYEGLSVAPEVGTPDHIPQLRVPVGQTILIKLHSVDVVHAFYLPDALFKRQAIPNAGNEPTEFTLKFDKVGTFHGQCTQFCGLAHDRMLFDVIVMPPDDFQTWTSSSRGSGT